MLAHTVTIIFYKSEHNWKIIICSSLNTFFDASTLHVQVAVSELTHQLTPPPMHTHTPSAQARPTPIRRGCMWVRGIRSHPGFTHDGHVILTIVAHPRVRLLMLLSRTQPGHCWGKTPVRHQHRTHGSNTGGQQTNHWLLPSALRAVLSSLNTCSKIWTFFSLYNPGALEISPYLVKEIHKRFPLSLL
jgi:hypothetical protein